MKNLMVAVCAVLSILLGFHIDHSAMRFLVNNSWKIVFAGVSLILNQPHNAGFVPAGNAGLILNIFGI